MTRAKLRTAPPRSTKLQAVEPRPRSAVGVKPRLVFLMPGLIMGGAERHTIDLVQRLRRDDYEVGLVVYGARGTPEMQALGRAEGAVVLGLKGLSSLSGWSTFARELRRQNADVILSIHPKEAVAALVLRSLGLIRGKIACVFHSSHVAPNHRVLFALFRRLAPWLDLLVYVGRAQQQSWERRGLKPRRSTAIPNGVDMKLFDPKRAPPHGLRASLGFEPSDYVIGIVAGLRPEKNHEELVEALAILRDRGVPAKLLIIGDGDRRPAIEARAEALRVSDRIVFAGVQSDVRPYVLACDIGVLCSKTEAFALATLEVLALGVPMVSSDVGAQREVITPGLNGEIYPPGEPAALAAHLAELADPERRARLATRARDSVLKYDVERMTEQYEAAVESL